MTVKEDVEEAIKTNHIVVYSKSYCPYCRRAKSLLASIPDKVAEPKVYELDMMGQDGVETQKYLSELTGQGTVPNIFIGHKHIGGADDLSSLNAIGGLKPLVTNPKISNSRVYGNAFRPLSQAPNQLFSGVAILVMIAAVAWFGRRLIQGQIQSATKEKL